jgi:hypothetical protein
VIEDVLHRGIILTNFVLVGHAYFLSVIVLGRTPQKNRFDPPSPALTHPHPFRSVSPRYARLHSKEWMGMNLQKEVYTPFLKIYVIIISILIERRGYFTHIYLSATSEFAPARGTEFGHMAGYGAGAI